VLTTHSSIYAAGTVIAQDPAPYKEANGAKQVTLLLSTGNRDDANLMPDFVGRNVGEIIEEIIERTRRGSFPEARFQYVEHVSADAGTVVAQTPPPEAKVEEDHQVVLYISKGQ
jgi:beta-lactam-binding protein with PASTA domain